MEIFLSNNPAETEQIAGELAKKLESRTVIAFRGDLGMGKTCFTRGLATGLGYTGEVNSPTFALVNEYFGGRLPLYHFDMYRISSWDELYSSGYFEYLELDGIIVAEWSENIENALPKNTIYVEFEALSENIRKISIYNKEE